MSVTAALHRTVTARVDGRPLACARIVIGAAVLVRALEGWRILSAVLDPQRVQMPLLDRLPRISLAALPLLIGVWCLAGVLLMLGWRTRTAALSSVVVIAYVLVVDQQAYSNHLYLMGLLCLLLAVSDCGARYSLDALRRRGRRGRCCY